MPRSKKTDPIVDIEPTSSMPKKTRRPRKPLATKSFRPSATEVQGPTTPRSTKSFRRPRSETSQPAPRQRYGRVKPTEKPFGRSIMPGNASGKSSINRTEPLVSYGSKIPVSGSKKPPITKPQVVMYPRVTDNLVSIPLETLDRLRSEKISTATELARVRLITAPRDEQGKADRIARSVVTAMDADRSARSRLESELRSQADARSDRQTHINLPVPSRVTEVTLPPNLGRFPAVSALNVRHHGLPDNVARGFAAGVSRTRATAPPSYVGSIAPFDSASQAGGPATTLVQESGDQPRSTPAGEGLGACNRGGIIDLSNKRPNTHTFRTMGGAIATIPINLGANTAVTTSSLIAGGGKRFISQSYEPAQGRDYMEDRVKYLGHYNDDGMIQTSRERPSWSNPPDKGTAPNIKTYGPAVANANPNTGRVAFDTTQSTSERAEYIASNAVAIKPNPVNTGNNARDQYPRSKIYTDRYMPAKTFNYQVIGN
jgi:hypothetical protein